MDVPTLAQARLVRAAVAGMWNTAMRGPRSAQAEATMQVARIALRGYLSPEDEEDLPGAVARLEDRVQQSIYYSRDGTEGNHAWRHLYVVMSAALDPTPHTPSEGAAP